ncbi:ROK family transcriptional regulator [Pacificibacter sp. AS14]|uniref:ROK family transcriptional regulator n=1 Tax=Pacificibacter sp. AS14 TaxID=3135785 RepID=UPI0031768DA0
MVNISAMNSQSLRKYHRSLVLRLVADGITTRTDLAEAIGLSSMGITRIVNELMDAGLIATRGKRTNLTGPGRHSARLEIKPDGAFFIGVTVSAFTNELVCVDATGHIQCRLPFSCEDVSDADAVVEAIAMTLKQLLIGEDIDESRILGMGATVSGIVDRANGTVTRAGYLGWEDISFAAKLKAATGFDVVVENLANAMNMSKHRFGIANGRHSTLLVSGGTTCGSSFAQAGEPLRGYTFEAGQLGHARVTPNDLTCSCGRNDCLNTVASGWSILARSGRVKDRTFQGAHTNQYADALTELLEGVAPKEVSKLLRDAGKNLAHATAEACLFLNPDMVLVVGAMAVSPDFAEGFSEAWDVVRLGDVATKPSYTMDTTPDVAAAAHLAMDEFFFSPKLALPQVSATDARSNHA